jgi:hypothetical protein
MKKNLKSVSFAVVALTLMAQGAHASSVALSTVATGVGVAATMIENPDDLRRDSSAIGQKAGEGTSKTPGALSASSQGTSQGMSQRSNFRIVGNDVVLKEAVEFVSQINSVEPQSISPALRGALVSERNALKESFSASEVDAMSDQEVAHSMILRMTSEAAAQ